MSGDALGQVWYHCQELTPAQIVVLAAVADVVNDAHGNEFWMSSPSLAAKVCMDAGNVRHRLLELTEAGWIEVLGRGAHGVVRYRWLGCVEGTRVDSTRVETTRVQETPAARSEDAAPASTARTPSSYVTQGNSTESNDVARGLACLLAELIRHRDPKAKVRPDGWVTDIDRLIRLDGRAPEEIERVIRWCQQDTFWQSNILSGKKLREKFTALYAKAHAMSNGNGRGNTRESLDAATAEFLAKHQ